MLGTIVNMGAVIAGGVIGILINKKLPVKVVEIVFQGLGLVTLFLGMSMAFKTSEFLILIFSVVGGGILGELLGIENGVNKFSEWLKRKLKNDNQKFSEGLVTAFILYCMGSMTILGAFEEGMGEAPNLLMAKSLMDGISSIALASALGVGVIFSIIPMLIFQGGLTLFAAALHDVISPEIINELTAVGGVILIGLGINILEIKKLRILNLLPGLFIAVALAYFFI